MNYMNLLVSSSFAPVNHGQELPALVPVELKGIGDEPNQEVFVAHGKRVVSNHRGRRDLHNSFPKGLPKVFELERS